MKIHRRHKQLVFDDFNRTYFAKFLRVAPKSKVNM
jgi:hypothetical protein